MGGCSFNAVLLARYQMSVHSATYHAPLHLLPYYQTYAENHLLNDAQQLKEELCITFNQAMSLAKTMDTPLTRISQWK